MREQRNDPKRLKDILQAIDTIFEYVEGRGMEDFIADKRSYHAVIYNQKLMVLMGGKVTNYFVTLQEFLYFCSGNT